MPTNPTQLSPVWQVFYELSTPEEREEITTILLARVHAADHPATARELKYEIKQLLGGMEKEALVKVFNFVRKISACYEIVSPEESQRAIAEIFNTEALQVIDQDWS